MVLVYLVLGAAVGLTAAIAGWLAGVSVWGALGLYVLSGIGVILAGALVIALRSLLGRLAKAVAASRPLPRGDLLER